MKLVCHNGMQVLSWTVLSELVLLCGGIRHEECVSFLAFIVWWNMFWEGAVAWFERRVKNDTVWSSGKEQTLWTPQKTYLGASGNKFLAIHNRLDTPQKVMKCSDTCLRLVNDSAERLHNLSSRILPYKGKVKYLHFCEIHSFWGAQIKIFSSKGSMVFFYFCNFQKYCRYNYSDQKKYTKINF